MKWYNTIFQVRYYTEPPETPDSEVHVDAKIVSTLAQDFDINAFEAMEAETIDTLGGTNVDDAIKVTN